MTCVKMEVYAAGTVEELVRPCVDCGRLTGNYCDSCFAVDRLPSETWVQGQRTPLCTICDRQRDICHFCLGRSWVTPPMGYHSDGGGVSAAFISAPSKTPNQEDSQGGGRGVESDDRSHVGQSLASGSTGFDPRSYLNYECCSMCIGGLRRYVQTVFNDV